MNDYAKQIMLSHAIVWNYRRKLQHVWPTPPPKDSLRFAFTEAAEAMDAWLRLDERYARNNDKSLSVEDELADCAMMLFTAVGPDPLMVDEREVDRNDVTLDRLAYAIGLQLRRDTPLRGYVPYGIQQAMDIIAAWPGMDLPARITARLERIKAKRLGNRG